MTARVIAGDVLDKLPRLDAGGFDAVLCDPPYGLSFKGIWCVFCGRESAHRPGAVR